MHSLLIQWGYYHSWSTALRTNKIERLNTLIVIGDTKPFIDPLVFSGFLWHGGFIWYIVEERAAYGFGHKGIGHYRMLLAVGGAYVKDEAWNIENNASFVPHHREMQAGSISTHTSRPGFKIVTQLVANMMIASSRTGLSLSRWTEPLCGMSRSLWILVGHQVAVCSDRMILNAGCFVLAGHSRSVF